MTLLVAFNLENIAGSMGKVYQCWRDKVLEDMRSDNHWKERGEELQDLNPTRRTPSEWWLLGYLVYRLMGALTGKKRENKRKASRVDGDRACVTEP
jgi:hypothetical protein